MSNEPKLSSVVINSYNPNATAHSAAQQPPSRSLQELQLEN
jgi:hypothetical protein